MLLPRTFLVCFATLLLGISTAYADPPFPRIATVNYAAPQNYDSAAFQAQLGKYNIAMLSVWPGWNSGRAMTMQQSVQAIKKINPQELVFLYINNNEIYPASPAYAALVNKANAMHWWLYPSGTAGTPVPSAYGGTVEVNNTMFTQPDSNGDRWVDWYAKWAVTNFYVPNPSIDGFFTDNVFYRPRVNGDWNLDGVTDSASNPTVAQWYRNGYAHHFSVLQQQMPGKYQIGNIADWSSAPSIAPLSGVLNGGFLEGLIGFSYSTETWGSWAQMMAQYRQAMASVIAPKLVIFGQAGVAGDYKSFRYGFASCLMDDGYYQFSLASNAYSGTFWFDEFNTNLGTAVTSPPTSAWQNGVYRRDYTNGIALVNPRGNGARTVTLEANFYRISGTQDPATNNGQVVRTVTLNDRDGLILVRQTPVAAPAPPAPTAVVPQPPGSVIVQ